MPTGDTLPGQFSVFRQGECKGLLRVFQDLMGKLGILRADEKTEGPENTLMYLGIEHNTVQRQSHLIWDKFVVLKRHIVVRVSRTKTFV